MNPNDQLLKFWVDSFGKEPVVDWDIFVSTFTSFIDKTFKIRLDDLQKNEVKRIIDPNNHQQIRLSNFNLFLEDYWVLPANREKLFKKHFRPVDLEFENGLKSLDIDIDSVEMGPSYAKRSSTHNFKSNSLRQGNITNPTKHKNFVTIGSSEQADITLTSLHINPQHLKIFRHPLGFKVKDVSKSNRVLLSVDRNLCLKPGMVINFCSYELSVISLRLNPLPPSEDFLDPQLTPLLVQQVEDTTLTFTLKDLRFQSHSQHQINYKKHFQIGKNPDCDYVLYDQRSKGVCCSLVYSSENWFLEGKQEVGMYLANREEIDRGQSSGSVLVRNGMEVRMREGRVGFRLVRN